MIFETLIPENKSFYQKKTIKNEIKIFNWVNQKYFTLIDHKIKYQNIFSGLKIKNKFKFFK